MPITKGIIKPIVNATNVGNANIGKYFFIDFSITISSFLKKRRRMETPAPLLSKDFPSFILLLLLLLNHRVMLRIRKPIRQRMPS